MDMLQYYSSGRQVSLSAADPTPSVIAGVVSSLAGMRKPPLQHARIQYFAHVRITMCACYPQHNFTRQLTCADLSRYHASFVEAFIAPCLLLAGAIVGPWLEPIWPVRFKQCPQPGAACATLRPAHI
jgi:hypothetical protein